MPFERNFGHSDRFRHRCHTRLSHSDACLASKFAGPDFVGRCPLWLPGRNVPHPRSPSTHFSQLEFCRMGPSMGNLGTTFACFQEYILR
jgi:hypothetical protein